MEPTSAKPQSRTATPVEDAPRWTPRLVAVLVALAWPTQLLAAAGILGANSTASVAQSFQTAHVAWFGLTFTLVSTLLTPFVIKLGDKYGRKPVMLVMTGLGVIGDVIAATAGSFPLLLLGRAIGGCYGPFAALAFPAVRDVFPRRLVKPASGILGSSVGLVALAAPFLAGWLVDNWGYEGAMWFLAGATAVAFVLIAVLVPPTPRHDARPGFDWLGGLTLGGGLSAVVFAVGQGQAWGWASGKTLGWLAAGLAAVVLFLVVERRSLHPILDLEVLRRRPVALVLLTGGLAQAVAYTMPAMAILLALYPHIPGVSGGLGWSAQHNAVVGVSWNLVMFVTGLAASRLLRRIDARRIWWAGLSVMAAGYGLMGFFHGGEAELVATSCVAHLGAGLVVAVAPALVVGVVSKREQGLGSGMLNLLTSLFGTVATAGFFAVLAGHGSIVEGTTLYRDAGFAWVFWSGALIASGTLVVSLFIPALRGPEEPGAAT
ncbi:MFS transporter [Nocardiopsis chromatogenes]|uniref:MFS transporter n=1 Tax=Nocardiopsis chromatogenes TaxID=280239 RepID=UPI000475CEBD|nr:MFS transporter [Nocardiopsis chromatogenes]